MASAFIAVID